MERFELQKLRDLPIEGVAHQLGMKVQKHKTLCPFHEDRHPSLSFHTGRNTFKCFVCDAHGGVIDLTMQVLRKDFKEACRWLADEHNIIVSEWKPAESPQLITHNSKLITTKYAKYFAHPYLNAEARTFLFEERKLHPAVIRWCRLNSYTDRHDTPWLQIPYYDIDGHLIGIQNRRLSHPPLRGNEEVQPRFRFPRGSKCRIYNLPVLKMLKEGEDLWIAEGCSDCWALLSSGKKAIAIPSATLLRETDLESLNPKLSTLNLHMYPDADLPGEKLYLQLKTLYPEIIRHTLPTNHKDYSEYYASSH